MFLSRISFGSMILCLTFVFRKEMEKSNVNLEIENQPTGLPKSNLELGPSRGRQDEPR